MSEELEHSLQQAIETYLNQRLRTIDEQINQLQADLSEAFARLRESAASESLDGTPLSASVFAHFQAARAQKLTGAPPEPRDHEHDYVSAMKHGVELIEKQHSHSDVLGALLTSAVSFAERVALFVVKGDQAIGWKLCEANDPSNLESIRGVSLPLSAETSVSHAANSRSSWKGAADSSSGDRGLVDQLGGGSQTVAVVPLVARGKVVAVLYADSPSSDRDAINLDGLEVLTRVAAMAVVLAAGGAHPVQAPASEPAPSAVQEEQVATQPPVFEAVSEPEPTYMPQVEIQAPEVESPAPVFEATAPEVVTESEVVEPVTAEPFDEAPPAVEEFEVQPPVETFVEPTIELTAPPPAFEVMSEPVPEPVSAESEVESSPIAEAPAFDSAYELPAPEIATQAPAIASLSEQSEIEPEVQAPSAPEEVAPEPIEAAPITQPLPPPADHVFSASFATPLGSARRYGVIEPELPIDVSEDERRLHNDARRFARLLVSEIKLYNESKVREGRSQSDLYDRLREDIDRSRQMYDKRVAPHVAARHDYFHQELVNTLAEGDPEKLGADYPGALAMAG